MKTSNSEKMASQEHVSGSVYCAARLQQIQGLTRKIKNLNNQKSKAPTAVEELF